MIGRIVADHFHVIGRMASPYWYCAVPATASK